MRQVVNRVFLYETSPALKTNCIAVAEWDAEARRFYVGDLCLPESAAKEWLVVRPAPVEKPEASTQPLPPEVLVDALQDRPVPSSGKLISSKPIDRMPTPAPTVRKGPSRK